MSALIFLVMLSLLMLFFVMIHRMHQLCLAALDMSEVISIHARLVKQMSEGVRTDSTRLVLIQDCVTSWEQL